MNTIFEQIGGTYAEKDGYLYPNIMIPEEDMQPIGKYGRMRKRYLKEHRPVVYNQLIVSGKLFSHLREIDSTCNARMEQMVKQMAKAENVTESLKAENQMEWVARMNGIQNRAEEIILEELIYN
ncbi:MAG: TnpV protein [Clostridia bacterium]|nr:TnpV protein [Clostridia bacterium]